MCRTKIVCTLGPAASDEATLRGLMQAGMDVARVNFSHGDHETHAQTIALLNRLSTEEGKLVAIMADLQGPKLRVGEIAGGQLHLRQGDEFTLTTRPVPGSTEAVHLPHPEIVRDLGQGQRVLLDDGQIELTVIGKTGTDLLCRIVTGGFLSSHKGVNLPGAHLRVSSLTEKDREDALFAVEQGVDFLALSFVRRPADVLELRRFLQAHDADRPIIAKIEKPEALEVFDAILEASDGVMVARGDLGVETPPEEVPFHQKNIIRAANCAGKPVITATQMLQSMIEHPRPTRAEASDVANAILDGTDAVMLSGETAIGAYPIEAARTMQTIAANAEEHLPHDRWAHLLTVDADMTSGSAWLAGAARSASTIQLESSIDPTQTFPVTEAISQATVEVALTVGAKAIITSTMSGTTARMVARHRPSVPIIAATPNPVTWRQLALVWGVQPVLVEDFDHTDEMIHLTVQAACKVGVVSWGDEVVITAGIPFGGLGSTNFLKVHSVGELGEV
jgi:pyruvate kinase